MAPIHNKIAQYSAALLPIHKNFMSNQSHESDFALTGIEDSRLYNADLAPVSPSQRKWGMWSIAALWISMAACVPTYMLASSLIEGGMNWSQAIFTVFLGNLIVVIPMVLNAHAGTKYGIPFPVFAARHLEFLAQIFQRSCAPLWRADGSAFKRGLVARPSLKLAPHFSVAY